ncbi:copper transporter [Cellulomonas triticagri]|uniref:Copper transporter n=1 Tax=Cellulomonas triticagri TaxID=2483352 RepID=A0A3M2IWD2_9CELL|nr:copper transporter [Cellulomonas triticagri]RMI03623.1 copper transporter [Cellulomonas triticagri]
MIDFRYHLVSLISVFLALAVGIVLGAGPLRETIGDTLTGQVDQLRSERDELRNQLDAAAADQAAADAFVDAAGTDLVDGTLTDRRVAVVALGEVDADALTAVEGRLSDAGAQVSARVTLTEAWSSTDLRSFRQALVGNIVSYLDPAPAADATVDTSVAEALVQGLTGADPAQPDALSGDAATLLELLTSGDSPLVTLGEEVTAPADAVVLVTPGIAAEAVATEDPADTEEAEAVLASQVALARVAQTRSEGAVVVDGPVVQGSLVSTILADGSAADALTTVSGADGVSGQVSVPLALNATIGGTTGHYGYGDDLTVLPATTVLPLPDRTPAGTEGPDAGAGDAGDAGADATAGAEG